MFLHLSVSPSVHRGGEGVCPIACWDTPTPLPRDQRQTLPPGPKADTLPPRTKGRPPGPKADTSPQDQRQTLPPRTKGRPAGPKADTSPQDQRQTLPPRTKGRPPGPKADTSPPGDGYCCGPKADTSPLPLNRRLLLWTVRILLECILVCTNYLMVRNYF